MAPRNLQERYPRLLARLEEVGRHGATALELAEHLHLAKRNVLMYLRLMLDEKPMPLVYIIDWRVQPPGVPGSPAPIYARKTRAHQKDAPKPEPKSNAQKQADYRDRNKALIKAKKAAKRGTATPFTQLGAKP